MEHYRTPRLWILNSSSLSCLPCTASTICRKVLETPKNATSLSFIVNTGRASCRITWAVHSQTITTVDDNMAVCCTLSIRIWYSNALTAIKQCAAMHAYMQSKQHDTFADIRVWWGLRRQQNYWQVFRTIGFDVSRTNANDVSLIQWAIRRYNFLHNSELTTIL